MARRKHLPPLHDNRAVLAEMLGDEGVLKVPRMRGPAAVLPNHCEVCGTSNAYVMGQHRPVTCGGCGSKLHYVKATKVAWETYPRDWSEATREARDGR